jgi:hypothetical protein
MPGLAGLSGLSGSVRVSTEASAEERLGGPADPRHAEAVLDDSAYPWEVLAGVRVPHGPYGNHAGLVGSTEGWIPPAGTPDQDPLFDSSPRTHAAPHVAGVEQSTDPDATARFLTQSAAVHAIGTGASTRMHATIAAQQDDWADFYTVDAGSSLQDPGMPGQLKAAAGGYGTTDRVSSFARQNEHGFDAAHLHRRYATGSVPGNYMWMRPAGRPMVKTQAGPARPPVGLNSPFTGQDLTRDYGVQGAVLQDAATEYVAPPEPYLAPVQGPAPDAAPVAWW